MLNILSLKKKQKESAAGGPGAAGKGKTTAAQIRIQKDLSELDALPKSIKMNFPDPNNLYTFNLDISPDDGFYKGGHFKFKVVINSNYPHDPPKVTCTQVIYHPNIDLEGNVCLNILREDWKPVLNLHSVLIGMQYLFLEPNPDDPLNKIAAEQLRSDRKLFGERVKKSMGGTSIDGVTYDRVL